MRSAIRRPRVQYGLFCPVLFQASSPCNACVCVRGSYLFPSHKHILLNSEKAAACLPASQPARHVGERWVLLPFTGVGRQQRVRIATHTHMSDSRCHTLHELPTDLEIAASAATLASYIIRAH